MKDKSLALLTEQGSLTELMTELMGRSPLLKCRREGKSKASWEEQRLLSIQPRNMAHVREITMGLEDKAWLFARTVIPVATLRGSTKRIAKMKAVPLGKILFGTLNAKRTQMRLDIVFADEVGLESFAIDRDFPLWQRRSVFQLRTGPMLITEIFLPDCPIYDL